MVGLTFATLLRAPPVAEERLTELLAELRAPPALERLTELLERLLPELERLTELPERLLLELERLTELLERLLLELERLTLELERLLEPELLEREMVPPTALELEPDDELEDDDLDELVEDDLLLPPPRDCALTGVIASAIAATAASAILNVVFIMFNFSVQTKLYLTSCIIHTKFISARTKSQFSKAKKQLPKALPDSRS